MNTTNKEFDYQAYMKENAPNPAKIRRGLDALRAKKEAVKTKLTIRIDEDVIQQFRDLTPEGRGYQSLINQALREWLAAQDVKELIRQELAVIVDKAISSIEVRFKSPEHRTP